jgi:predicted  nucleic acid-binding Zn-ribbon protein
MADLELRSNQESTERTPQLQELETLRKELEETKKQLEATKNELATLKGGVTLPSTPIDA